MLCEVRRGIHFCSTGPCFRSLLYMQFKVLYLVSQTCNTTKLQQTGQNKAKELLPRFSKVSSHFPYLPTNRHQKHTVHHQNTEVCGKCCLHDNCYCEEAQTKHFTNTRKHTLRKEEKSINTKEFKLLYRLTTLRPQFIQRIIVEFN